MKKVLVIGANSYIASSFCAYAKNRLNICAVSASGGQWKQLDFHGFDTVINFAGIAHRKETAQSAPLYYQVNRDLAVEIGREAKERGVNQYIFLSSMSVYGLTTGRITPQTQPSPVSHYGKSKLEAEQLITQLADETFCAAILRPPMVYGAGCKGNFQSLCSFAKKTPVFPDLSNQRSMIFIDNLCELICLICEKKSGGIFCPQDKNYACTREIICVVGAALHKTVHLTKLFNPLARHLRKRNPLFAKVFGDLTYSKELSSYFNGAYQIIDSQTAVARSVTI